MTQAQHTLFTVEAHTMGEPLRLIVGGVPQLKGATIPEKREYFIQHYDYLRRALMQEPRGHKDMFGCLLTPPTLPEADTGVIFMHGDGFHNMCGHGTIAVSTILVETGMVEVREPETVIRLEAPAGLVTVRVQVAEGRARSVSFENVPAFLYKENVPLTVPGLGRLAVDIAFGGSFFAIVDSARLGLEIRPENASRLTEAGMKILEAANGTIEVRHPELPHIKTIDLCEIWGPPRSPEARLQNVTVFGGQVDRSPCGTGTSAKLAELWTRGEIQLHEPFVYESVIGTRFTGRALRETKVGDFPAIVPEITGSAFITGYSQFVIDEDDPVKYGFRLG
ncbi:MAG: proline racemase family protein [Firmicutes bacterium]|nr:proline racemase family protein [Bacillota bacterium]